jgi:hypothetical protein
MPNHARHRPGKGEPLVLQALARAERHGLNTQQVADVLRATRNRAGAVLTNLANAGLVYRRWHGGRAPAQWWLASHAPADASSIVGPRQRLHAVRQPPARVGLDPATPATNPHGVQVRVIPHGTDHRFTFTPPAGWRGGQITRDWRARRLAEAKR